MSSVLMLGVENRSRFSNFVVSVLWQFNFWNKPQKGRRTRMKMPWACLFLLYCSGYLCLHTFSFSRLMLSRTSSVSWRMLVLSWTEPDRKQKLEVTSVLSDRSLETSETLDVPCVPPTAVLLLLCSVLNWNTRPLSSIPSTTLSGHTHVGWEYFLNM